MDMISSGSAASAARRRKVAAAVVILAAVLVLGAYAFTRRSGGSAALLPDAVARAFVSLGTEDTYRVRGELALHLPPRLRGRARPLTEITTAIDGVMARGAEGEREFAGTFRAEAAGQGTVFRVAGDMRALSDATFFYLREFPALLNPSGRLAEAWTRVPAPLLQVRNGGEVQQALAGAAAHAVFAGREKTDAGQLARFTATLPTEIEAELARVLSRSASSSPTLDVVARLLAANDVQSLDIWVDTKTERLVRVEAHFVRPLSDGSFFDFATLSLAFSDYTIPASVDRPEARLTVQPEVFRRLFGGGAVEEIHVQESDS